MKIKNWIIKKLGGYSSEEYQMTKNIADNVPVTYYISEERVFPLTYGHSSPCLRETSYEEMTDDIVYSIGQQLLAGGFIKFKEDVNCFNGRRVLVGQVLAVKEGHCVRTDFR